MPRYDYICNNNECKVETFEVRTESFEEGTVRCTKCNVYTNDRKSVYQFSFTGLGES